MPDLVLGHGPSGVRAAAALGGECLLLDPDVEAGGVRFPELPEGLGHALGTQGGAGAIKAAYGAAPDLAPGATGRRLVVDGATVDLPMRRRGLAQVLPQDDAARILTEQARIYARAHLRKVIGGGAEERTYQDWVVTRFGETAYELLHEPYAARRWGDPGLLNVSVAWIHHGPADGQDRVALGASPESGWRSLVARAGQRIGGVVLESLEVVDGRVARVLTDQGAHDVDGRLIYTGPLPALGELLGDALDEGLRWDLARLGHRHRVQVALQVEGQDRDLSAELHVVRGDAPFFRLTAPRHLPGCSELSSTLIAHLSCQDGDGTWQATDEDLARRVVSALPALGLPSASAGGARVQRYPAFDPAWVGPWHPVMVRVLLAMKALGIELAGRAGAYQWVDPGRELLHLAALQGAGAGDPRELVRTLLDPPVKPDVARLTMAQFVTG